MCLYGKKNGENIDGVQSACKMINYSCARRESEQRTNRLFIFPSIMGRLRPRQICGKKKGRICFHQKPYLSVAFPHSHSGSKNSPSCPGWCGSVDWTPAWEPKGCWFDSQSGHMSGLQARYPVQGTREATAHWCFSPSLSPSLSLSLKINKIL